MTEVFHRIVNSVGFILNIIGAFIIVWGAAISLIEFLRNEIFRRGGLPRFNEETRIKLGGYLILALEFFIAGDIIKTIITPTWESLGVLAAVVIIRTVLSYFLTADLKNRQKGGE